MLTKKEKEEVIMAINFYKDVKEKRREFVAIPIPLISKNRELQLHMKSVIVSYKVSEYPKVF